MRLSEHTDLIPATLIRLCLHAKWKLKKQLRGIKPVAESLPPKHLLDQQPRVLRVLSLLTPTPTPSPSQV